MTRSGRGTLDSSERANRSAADLAAASALVSVARFPRRPGCRAVLMGVLWVAITALRPVEPKPHVDAPLGTDGSPSGETAVPQRRYFDTVRLQVAVRQVLTEQYQIEAVDTVACQARRS